MQDARALSSFEKEWLLVHMASGISLACMYLEGSYLLWIMPCGSDARRRIARLNHEHDAVGVHWYLMIAMAFAAFLVKAGYLATDAERDTPRDILAICQWFLLWGAYLLGSAAYDNYAGPGYAVKLLCVHTGFAA